MEQYEEKRNLPVGQQSFEEIRRTDAVYVDKTDLVWQLTHSRKYNYLSRPRRFGKSLLVDTLACYFEGKRELFEGLKIMELEKEWAAYPVIRLDMSKGGDSAEKLNNFFDRTFKAYEEKYEIDVPQANDLTGRFQGIIDKAVKTTGRQAVILIDEYDSPLQHSWKTPEHEKCTAIYRNVFAVLKSEDVNERFVFITGITKFTQVSVFSALNNLKNISFAPEYAAICGITQQEVEDNFKPEIRAMAEENGWTYDETLANLKLSYDGYHFSARNMVDVYNPFSLITALDDSEISNTWASSGATHMLPKFVTNMELTLPDYDGCKIEENILKTSDVTDGGAALFLYQSGYLTIKSLSNKVFTLCFPNAEVREALYKVVVPALTLKSGSEVVNEQGTLREALAEGNLPTAFKALKALVLGVPYSNKKMESMDMEERYRFIISVILRAIAMNVEVEHMMAKGRIDILAQNSAFTYVMELKLSKAGGIAAAEKQIRDNLYGEPFKADSRELIALAVELDDEGKGIGEWKRVEG